MKNSIKILSALFMFLIILSCQNEDYVLENQSIIKTITSENFDDFVTSVKLNMSQNEKFVNNFINKIDRKEEVNKELMLKMLNILNITVDTNVDKLTNVYEGVYKRKTTHSLNKPPPLGDEDDDCEKLVKIRNAMLDECDRYVIGLDDACSAAVMIAYWVKSVGC